MFFGRVMELREITERIVSTSYAIIGGRRVGKSSLLFNKLRGLVDSGLGHAVLSGKRNGFYIILLTSWEGAKVWKPSADSKRYGSIERKPIGGKKGANSPGNRNMLLLRFRYQSRGQ